MRRGWWLVIFWNIFSLKNTAFLEMKYKQQIAMVILILFQMLKRDDDH